MYAAGAWVGAGSDQGAAKRLVRGIDAVTVKDFPLEIWQDKQRNMFRLDENQMSCVCIFFFFRKAQKKRRLEILEFRLDVDKIVQTLEILPCWTQIDEE